MPGATAMFDREWALTDFTKAFAGGQLILAAFLLMLAIMIITAVALAASTRLGQVLTLMTCFIVLVAGFLSDWVIGQHREDSAIADILYRVTPNINFFWIVDAITASIDIPITYVLYTTAYAILFITTILLIGIALFQRREIG